ncbi:angiopoietin-4-like [Anopheles aquasalis]|uniref:angiopoietin-4-like n=1 Tax=Anopheles aquasalis TaxID=42839 RepID=UPI00215ACD92|nr:angiopoietin-4-like [Anopheles aquasalis]
MKLSNGLLLLCVLYAAEATNSSGAENANLQIPTVDAMLTKLEKINWKLSQLQIDLNEHREAMERNRDCVTSNAASLEESTTPAATTTTTPEPPIRSYSSCRNVPTKASGVYHIRLNNVSLINVYCEQEKFGGGWMVIQHRFNGSVDFYRNWTEYRDGFGELDGEFWLGLEHVHQLTRARTYELIVEMKDFKGNYGYTRYIRFKVDSESQQYELTLASGLDSGRAGDGLYGCHTGVKFSTRDRDNDETPDEHYAVRYTGAWWYCMGGGVSNLNGPYKNSIDTWNSTVWYYFKADLRGLSYTRMMIREI